MNCGQCLCLHLRLAAMGYVCTGMGDRLSALLVSLMALWLTPEDQNPFQPC